MKVRQREDESWQEVTALARRQRRYLAESILRFGRKVGCQFNSQVQAEAIDENKNELSRPIEVIRYVSSTQRKLKQLLHSRYTPNDISNFTKEFGAIVAHLFPTEDFSRSKLYLKDLLERLEGLLAEDLFDEAIALDLVDTARKAGDERKAAEERIVGELSTQSRLKMATIGSSHLLTETKSHDQDAVISGFDGLNLSDSDNEPEGPDTVIIYDEAGCIPSYELLGLSRLGCNIVALIVVGDEHQLPPYDPSSGRGTNKRGNTSATDSKQIQSLLGASKLSLDDGTKVRLSVQYRVPRDIAELMNSRIYGGNYRTLAETNVPEKGFFFTHVPYSEHPRKKYVNENEIDKGIQLLLKSKREGFSSLLVLTPVSLPPGTKWHARNNCCLTPNALSFMISIKTSSANSNSG